MASSTIDFISEFEKQAVKEIKEKKAFESLSKEELTEKIYELKKNCFILQLKNEIFENYLKRHNFGALREMDKFLKKSGYENINIEKDFEEEEKLASLTSKELLLNIPDTPDLAERENILFLIKVVEQEISEICLKSKALKKKHENKIVFVSGENEAFKAQVSVLEEIHSFMMENYPEKTRIKSKDQNTQEFEFLRFMEKVVKFTNVQKRKISREAHKTEKKYSDILKQKYIEEQPVTLVDVKLLEIENEKLKKELEKDDQAYLDLCRLLDNYRTKLKKEVSSLEKVKLEKQNLENEIKKHDRIRKSLGTCINPWTTTLGQPKDQHALDKL